MPTPMDALRGRRVLLGPVENVSWQATLRYTAKVLALALAYFAAAKAGLLLAYENSSVTAVWAPTGISLAAPSSCGAAACGRASPSGPCWPTAGPAFPSSPCWGSRPATRWRRSSARACCGSPASGRRSNVRATCSAPAALAAVLSTMVSATVGVASLYAGDSISASALASGWRTWWVGDLVGDLLIAPLILVFAEQIPARPRPGRLIEGAALLAALVGASYLVFSSDSTRAFVLVPLMTWVALRFRQRGVVVGSLVVAAIADAFTANGMGPFVESTPEASLLVSQTFVGIGAPPWPHCWWRRLRPNERGRGHAQAGARHARGPGSRSGRRSSREARLRWRRCSRSPSWAPGSGISRRTR